MYICQECGKVYEKKSHNFECEKCGEKLEKAVPCENCGAWVAETNCLCDNCLEKYKTLDVALDIGGEWSGCISLNGFLISFYSRKDIEQILFDSIRNERQERVNKAVERYCNEDKECFKECAERKWNEEKSSI